MNKKDKKLAVIYLMLLGSGVIGGAGLMLGFIAELLDSFQLTAISMMILILALITLVITYIYEHEYKYHVKGDKS